MWTGNKENSRVRHNEIRESKRLERAFDFGRTPLQCDSHRNADARADTAGTADVADFFDFLSQLSFVCHETSLKKMCLLFL